MPVKQGRTALYRFFDADDRLLYVGVSSRPAARWKHHRATKPWAHEVVLRVIEWLPSRPEALAAETQAIHTERPKYNVSQSPAPPRRNLPRPAMRFLDASDVEMAAGYLAIQDVAEMLKVKPSNVNVWRWGSRPGRHYASDPFPAQDGVIRHHPVWKVERADEIRQWYGRRQKRKPRATTTDQRELSASKAN